MLHVHMYSFIAFVFVLLMSVFGKNRCLDIIIIHMTTINCVLVISLAECIQVFRKGI